MSAEKAEVAVPSAPAPDAGALARAFDRSTSTASDGKRLELPRRRVTFQLDTALCEPGVFDVDVLEITLVSLNSRTELEAAQQADGDAIKLGMILARHSIEAVNGVPLQRASGQDEWFWNVLGGGGRQLVMKMFSDMGGVTREALGKAQATLRVH